MTKCIACLKRSESGAAAVEFALVGLVAIGLFLGIVEFGRGLYMRNALYFAMDLASRKIMTDAAVANGDVETAIRGAVGFGASSNLQISFGTESLDGVAFRTILIRYPITMLIPGFTNGSFTLSLNRRVPLS